jgi:hypothetical protein
MAKKKKQFEILVTWTQDLSLELKVEAGSLEEATKMALAIDPNALTDKQIGQIEFGDVVSDSEHFVNGDDVGTNCCPYGDEEEEVDND